MELTAIGMIEVSSIASGIEAHDAMLKAAEVRSLIARTICSGKFIVVIAGDVAAVRASVDAGIDSAGASLIEQLVIPNVHPSVFPALAQTVPIPEEGREALGIVETFSAASVIEGADAAAKAANVTLFRVHVAMAVGGKGFLLLTGTVAAVNAAVDAAVAMVGERGMLVNRVVIPRAVPEVFEPYL